MLTGRCPPEPRRTSNKSASWTMQSQRTSGRRGSSASGPAPVSLSLVAEAQRGPIEFIAMFARNLQTHRVSHGELFESTGMSADALARKISMRTDELHARFAV